MEQQQQPIEKQLDVLALTPTANAIDGDSANAETRPQTQQQASAQVNDIGSSAATATPLSDDGDNEKWGLPLNELYRLGFGFYKEKSGKAIHLSYEDNLKLIAFTQQVSHGPHDPLTAPPLGVFDVIGRNRRLAWQQLGTLTRPQSQDGFVELLDRLCPLFKPYVEAIKQDRAEKRRLAIEQERLASEHQAHERRRDDERRRAEEQSNREEQQRRQLQDALNQQTFEQFRAYAEKQYPGNPDEQAVLIRQLQTEHYHQYMQQLQAQMVIDTLGGDKSADDPMAKYDVEAGGCNAMNDSRQLVVQHKCVIEGESNSHTDGYDGEASERSGSSSQCEFPSAGVANMWTRPDIDEFKKSVSLDKGDGVLHVGHGSMVTVRVPTREGGSCLFWEFATDAYDIGFGLYFEWGKSPTQDVTVTVDEDEEDEEDEDLAEEAIADLESGSGQLDASLIEAELGQYQSSTPSPIVTSIFPIYRRDSHKEVYAGTHVYPGEGVYLLKFDNCFSMWRSKTLYYRVFYSRS